MFDNTFIKILLIMIWCFVCIILGHVRIVSWTIAAAIIVLSLGKDHEPEGGVMTKTKTSFDMRDEEFASEYKKAREVLDAYDNGMNRAIDIIKEQIKKRINVTNTLPEQQLAYKSLLARIDSLFDYLKKRGNRGNHEFN